MPDIFYRVLHLVGLIMVFMGIGALVIVARTSGDRALRKLAAMTHGLGLGLVFISGFGLLAKVNAANGVEQSIPGYLWVKMAIWLALGGIIALILRRPNISTLAWWLTVALGGTAGYLVWAKPF